MTSNEEVIEIKYEFIGEEGNWLRDGRAKMAPKDDSFLDMVTLYYTSKGCPQVEVDLMKFYKSHNLIWLYDRLNSRRPLTTIDKKALIYYFENVSHGNQNP